MHGSNDSNPVNKGELSEHTGISKDYIEQIMHPMKRRGLIKSKRGVHGGYWLGKPLTEINVLMVSNAVNEKIYHPVQSDRCSAIYSNIEVALCGVGLRKIMSDILTSRRK